MIIIITTMIAIFLFFCAVISSNSSKKKSQDIERITRLVMARNTAYINANSARKLAYVNKPVYSMKAKTGNNASYSRNKNRYTSDDGDSMMMVHSVVGSFSNSSYDSPSSSSFSCDTSSSSSSSSSSCDSGGSSSE